MPRSFTMPPPSLSARVVLRNVAVPPKLPRPPPANADLPTRVLLITTRAPPFQMPPPAPAATLPVRVLSVSRSAPLGLLKMPPPRSSSAMLSAKVHWSIVIVPWFSIAPPSISRAILLTKVQRVSVAVPRFCRPPPPPPPGSVPERLPRTTLWVSINVPTFRRPPPPRQCGSDGLAHCPPCTVSPSSVKVPLAAMCRSRKTGALATRSIMVVSGPAPRRVSVLVIEGRPFRSLGDPSVVLSTAVRV